MFLTLGCLITTKGDYKYEKKQEFVRLLTIFFKTNIRMLLWGPALLWEDFLKTLEAS